MTAEQSAAFEQLRQLAAPHRFRVSADAEGFPMIPGRHGQIEWYHPDGSHLAAYTAGSSIRRGKLLSLPNIIRHQVGDSECRILFPVAMLPDGAQAIRARIRRTPKAAARLKLYRFPVRPRLT